MARLAMSTRPELRRLGVVAQAALSQGVTDAAVQIVLLTHDRPPRTPSTFEPVRHDGKGAWTQRQRYARLEQLHLAKTTEDLTAFDHGAA